MRFACERCGRRYASAAEPQPGRVYRHRCTCGNEIRVEVPPAVPSSTGAAARARTPAAVPLPAPSAAGPRAGPASVRSATLLDQGGPVALPPPARRVASRAAAARVIAVKPGLPHPARAGLEEPRMASPAIRPPTPTPAPQGWASIGAGSMPPGAAAEEPFPLPGGLAPPPLPSEPWTAAGLEEVSAEPLPPLWLEPPAQPAPATPRHAPGLPTARPTRAATSGRLRRPRTTSSGAATDGARRARRARDRGRWSTSTCSSRIRAGSCRSRRPPRQRGPGVRRRERRVASPGG